MSIRSAVVADIRPGKKAGVGSDVPFPFLLQELEFRGSISLDGCGPDATLAGGDAAVGLDFGGVGAIVRRQVVSGLHGTVPIPQGKAVHVNRKARL